MNGDAERARRVGVLVAERYPACTVPAQGLHNHWDLMQVSEIRLLVNTTSLGLQANDPELFEYSRLASAPVVYDLI